MDYFVLSLFCQNLDRSLTYLFVSPARHLVTNKTKKHWNQMTFINKQFIKYHIHCNMKMIKSNYISIYSDSTLYKMNKSTENHYQETKRKYFRIK